MEQDVITRRPVTFVAVDSVKNGYRNPRSAVLTGLFGKGICDPSLEVTSFLVSCPGSLKDLLSEEALPVILYDKDQSVNRWSPGFTWEESSPYWVRDLWRDGKVPYAVAIGANCMMNSYIMSGAVDHMARMFLNGTRTDGLPPWGLLPKAREAKNHGERRSRHRYAHFAR